MTLVYIILIMIFFHILDDFVLQAPCLCDLKQKKFWETNAPDEKYKYDYLWALLMHSFSWAFSISIPLIILKGFTLISLITFIINVGIHFIVDNLKANKFKLNLWQDQLIHMLQIILTALFVYMFT